MSHEQREMAEAELMADLLEIDRQASAAIWMAQAQGLPIEHRGDCSVQATLQIRLTTALAVPSPDSDPMLAFDVVTRTGERR